MTNSADNAAKLHAIGIHHRDRNEFHEALDAFEATRRLEEQVPEKTRAWWRLGMTLHEIAWLQVKLGRLHEALESYELAHDAKQRAPVVERDWNWFSTTLHESGHLQSMLGMQTEALRSFKSALAANINIADSATRREADVASLHALAHLLLEMKSWTAAVDALTAEIAVLGEQSMIARALYWRAFALVELEEWKAAEESALVSLQIYEAIPDPLTNHSDRAELLEELAQLSRRRGDRDVAATHFRAARSMRRRIPIS